LILIKRAINLKLFSFILCYDISLNENIFHQYIVSLDELFGYIHNILILLSKYFCNKIIESNDNIWVKKLQNLIDNYDPEKKPSNIIFEEIDNLCFKLTDNLFPFILQKYNHEKVIEIYNELNTLTQTDLYRLFRDNIFINMNINGSIIASSSYFEKNKNNFNYTPQIPYLVNASNKKYTLVLDLDETLIHFKVNPNNSNSGILQFRPYISEFLSNIKDFYELVVFTAATKDYADPIIDAIEQKGIKFDHRLYRIHTIIRGNDFVKDLSKLGRDLGRIIIVDNMEQNYKLQPYNGITIRPFWGKDTSDTALYDLLNILIKIVKMDMDVRDGIRYFKEEIISKVTSNIFRRVQK
jgi:Dullard-like phosphatase family protein